MPETGVIDATWKLTGKTQEKDTFAGCQIVIQKTNVISARLS